MSRSLYISLNFWSVLFSIFHSLSPVHVSFFSSPRYPVFSYSSLSQPKFHSQTLQLVSPLFLHLKLNCFANVSGPKHLSYTVKTCITCSNPSFYLKNCSNILLQYSRAYYQQIAQQISLICTYEITPTCFSHDVLLICEYRVATDSSHSLTYGTYH